MKRKIQHISGTATGGIFALAEDGSLWFGSYRFNDVLPVWRWDKLPELPDGEERDVPVAMMEEVGPRCHWCKLPLSDIEHTLSEDHALCDECWVAIHNNQEGDG
jgi:hypothetical protein